ncbi:MAG: bacteriophage abortive infection AbiH family protein, partial [Lachnospiraceae bacterium]|nr:bacteriophage abortive infection AbiH family protein [Lachnospiraceae bacterium]
MNILVIGNGFDLAHELPTKYTDFLFFCSTIKCIIKENKIDDKIPKDDENYFYWLNNDEKVLRSKVKIDNNSYIYSFRHYK